LILDNAFGKESQRQSVDAYNKNHPYKTTEKEKVLFPTNPKQSYLERNTHLTHQKIDQLLNQQNVIGSKIATQQSNQEIIAMRIEK
jgi:hypothetical protein